MKDKEVIELRQRISDLETALMSDLQNQLTAGTSSPSPPPSWGALGRMDSEEMTPGKMNSPGFALVAEAAEKEQMERQVRQLQKELSATKENYETMSKDYEQLEATLQECDSQKRGFAARYAFCLIDADHDGLIDLRGAERYELFAPYAHSVLERCFGMWEFTSGARGQMTLDDFLKFVYFAEEKTCKEAMNFWFRVIDIDGDGVWGRHDLLWFYQQVDKSGGCIAFDDFFCQITDMCDPEDPFQGITQRDVSTGGLGAGIIGLVVNHNNMLLQRTTADGGAATTRCEPQQHAAAEDHGGVGARQLPAVNPLGGAPVAAVLGERDAWWAGTTLDLPFERSRGRAVLPGPGGPGWQFCARWVR
eukprot:CAMPEP_0182855596 /NCGR_PEP_ID=MMETSP0034_2-20130328/1944_1 /TAXON_ID=156128 /ORGANISM="Nephroselmis pyriformis, Strain CCMP717" /LENGTH=361 /DNA_ID=CAMNT_0024986587 /DNA_START=15 /DNA_END=1098 /DNA_ORIENTATION=+